MKKISFLILLLSLLRADFFGLSGGIGYEEQKIGGYFKLNETKNYFGKHSINPPNQGYLGLDDKYNPYLWVKIIHPIPLVPNVKFQYTKYHSTGSSEYIAGNVEIFDDIKIPMALTNARSEFNINSYDLTMFYEFNPVVADIEVGVGVNYLKGKLKITGKSPLDLLNVNINSSFSLPIPYVYARVEGMDIAGYSIIANAKYAKLGDNHYYDYLGALKYTFDVYGPINPFVKAGYKYQEIYGVDGDNETKLSYKGIFLEIGAQF